MKSIIIDFHENPELVATVLTFSMIFVFISSYLLYSIVSSKRKRITHIYLSGEPESVVKEFTPGSVNLYWAVIKRLVKDVYEYLVEDMHTGRLTDWAKFMASWYGLLLILSIILTMVYFYALR